MTERIGKYELVDRIAVGGMAEVFLARQRGPAGFERDVVIKRVLPHFASDPEFVEMFLDEARISAQLAHPNIVQILDFGQADGQYFMALEYVRGLDLHVIRKELSLRGLRMPYDVVARCISDAAEGLHFAHQFADPSGKPMGLVHRDVSPSNIIVSKEGIARVLDFGVAKAATGSHKTRSGFIKGKVQYMAPEQVEELPLDARTDVFALGTVLFELCTGRVAFEGSEDVAIMRAIADKPLPVPRDLRSDIPPALESIIVTAMARSPDQRYASARLLAEELERFAVGLTGASASRYRVAEFVVALSGAIPSSGSVSSHRDAATNPESPARPRPDKPWAPDSSGLDATVVRSSSSGETPAGEGRRKGPLVAGISALIVIFLGTTFWWLTTRQATAEGSTPPVTTTSARLWVATDPVGGQITLDGELLGTSPIDAVTIPSGKHTLTARLIKTGIERGETFEVETGAEARRTIVFPKGTLMVLVKPWGKVFVDHALVGETPFPPLPLVAGRHTIEIVGPAGEVTSRSAEVHAGQEERLVIDLTAKKGR